MYIFAGATISDFRFFSSFIFRPAERMFDAFKTGFKTSKQQLQPLTKALEPLAARHLEKAAHVNT